MVGKSHAFLEVFYQRFLALDTTYTQYTIDDFYRMINHVAPNLIRIEADELYYHIHILIRYEIEKALIEGSIEVKDLPRVWNQKYKDYLGVDVPNDAQGVLQDTHWASGLFGYFPTYTMGTALSAVRTDALEADCGDIASLIKTSDGIVTIRAWLKNHIHQYGATYTVSELLAKNNIAFTHEALIHYLERKFCEYNTL